MKWTLLFSLLVLALPLLVSGGASPTTEKGAALPAAFHVYVGTFSANGSKGIYLFDLDTESGKLEAKGVVAEERDPNFLALHPNGKVLYSVATKNGGGAADAFSIDAASGKLTLLNQQATGGKNSVYVSVDPAGKVALVANYDGPSVTSFPVNADGSLGASGSVITHTGSSVNQGRQNRPYPHCVIPDPAGKFAFVSDLGCDKLFSYKIDAAKGTLTPNDPPAASVAPGSGPRHFAFHPSARFAYSLTELTNKIIAFSYDAERGTLKEIEAVSSLPADFRGWSAGSEIKAHPNGKFLYVGNRGHDSIGIFAIDQDSGKLTVVGHQSTRGQAPRGFNLDPTGNFLIAGNQGSNTISAFRIDPKTGLLTPLGEPEKSPCPVSILFAPVKE